MRLPDICGTTPVSIENNFKKANYSRNVIISNDILLRVQVQSARPQTNAGFRQRRFCSWVFDDFNFIHTYIRTKMLIIEEYISTFTVTRLVCRYGHLIYIPLAIRNVRDTCTSLMRSKTKYTYYIAVHFFYINPCTFSRQNQTDPHVVDCIFVGKLGWFTQTSRLCR